MLRRQPVATIEHIHQHEVRRAAIHILTERRLSTNTTGPGRRIRLKIGIIIRNQDVRPKHFRIQEVVHDHHEAIGTGAGRAVEGAVVERRVGHVVGRFEEILEFVKDVRDLSLVGAVVEEDDGAFAARDELPNGRPVIHCQLVGRSRGHEGILLHSRSLEGGIEHADVDEVAVRQQQGDLLGGIAIEPGFDGGEVGDQAAGVPEQAARVAHR